MFETTKSHDAVRSMTNIDPTSPFPPRFSFSTAECPTLCKPVLSLCCSFPRSFFRSFKIYKDTLPPHHFLIISSNKPSDVQFLLLHRTFHIALPRHTSTSNIYLEHPHRTSTSNPFTRAFVTFSSPALQFVFRIILGLLYAPPLTFVTHRLIFNR